MEMPTVDEKIMSTLESKQAIFDAFADKSVAAAESQQIDDRTFGNIIKEDSGCVEVLDRGKKGREIL